MIKWLVYYCYRIIRKYAKTPRHPEKTTINIFIYTGTIDQERLVIQANKIHWYLSRVFKKELHFFSDSHLLNTALENKGNQITVSNAMLSDVILVFDHSLLVSKLPTLWRYLSKVYLIDSSIGITDIRMWNMVVKEVLGGDTLHSIENIYKQNLTKAKTLFKDRSTAVGIGPGPSIDCVKSIPKEEMTERMVKVACNSVVKRLDLIEELGGIDILVFGDPIYHFSGAPYADVFRAHLTSLFDSGHRFFIVSPFYLSIYLFNQFPLLRDWLIGVPSDNNIEFNLNYNERFVVRGTDNILTFLLVPTLCSFAKEIYLVGFDGRNPEDAKNNKLWAYGKNAQLSDALVDGLKKYHPNHLKVEEEKYYVKHVAVVSEQLDFAESKGFEFSVIGNSYIPPLKTRISHYGSESTF